MRPSPAARIPSSARSASWPTIPIPTGERVLLDGAHLVRDALAPGSASRWSSSPPRGCAARPRKARSRARSSSAGVDVDGADDKRVRRAQSGADAVRHRRHRPRARSPAPAIICGRPRRVRRSRRSTSRIRATSGRCCARPRPAAPPGASSAARRPTRSRGRRCAAAWAARCACPIVAGMTAGRGPDLHEAGRPPHDRCGAARRRRSRRRSTGAAASALLARRRRPGPGRRIVARCDARVTIPMAPTVESLNVAVAGALLVYAARRQRIRCGASRMSSLFDAPEDDGSGAGGARAGRAGTPLAERMRPRTLDEVVGQDEILAPGKPLREAIERDLLQSIILWGPPGTGKTTLARVIAEMTQAHFVPFSAVLAGIKEIKEVMAAAAGPAAPHRPADDRLRRRDPPLQQGAAGRVPAARRSRRHRPDRRDHREPVVRGERRAAVAVEGVRPAAARRSDGRRARSCGARSTIASAAWARIDIEVTDEALSAIARFANGDARAALNLLEFSRGHRADGPGDDACGSSTCRSSSSRSSAGRCSTTRAARSTTT